MPGVRENGGQYTHAAIWTVMAFAALGDAARAWELFGMINPVHHGAIAGGDRASTRSSPTSSPPTSTRVAAAHRPRRLDLVHRLGRLDVPADHRIAAGPAPEGGPGPLHFAPCLPADWQAFKLHYRYRETFYHITVRQTSGAAAAMSVVVDGVVQAEPAIALIDDRVEHRVEVNLPQAD